VAEAGHSMTTAAILRRFKWVGTAPATYLVSWFLGLALLWAGVSKVSQPHEFLRAVYGFELIGPPWGRVVAMIVPHIEIVLGIALVGGVLLRPALLAAGTLLMLFLLPIAFALSRQLSVECGCFGGSSSVSGASLTLTAFMSLLAFVAAWSVGRAGRATPKRVPPGKRPLL